MRPGGEGVPALSYFGEDRDRIYSDVLVGIRRLRFGGPCL